MLFRYVGLECGFLAELLVAGRVVLAQVLSFLFVGLLVIPKSLFGCKFLTASGIRASVIAYILVGVSLVTAEVIVSLERLSASWLIADEWTLSRMLPNVLLEPARTVECSIAALVVTLILLRPLLEANVIVRCLMGR